MILQRLFLFAHVLSAFLYLLAHGASVAVAHRVHRETSTDRVHALLDLSRSTVGAARIALLSTIACGITLGFLGHWWSARWLWASIAVLVIVFVLMGRVAVPYFARIRTAAGLVLVDGTWRSGGRQPSSDELVKAVQSANPAAITGVAVAGWATILWLMLFKPF